MWRSGAREAPRHFGRQYDRGFQFRYPNRILLTFGPWDSVWPLGDRELPRTVLRDLQDGILRDGVVLSIWARSSVLNQLRTILAVGEVSIGSTRYGFTFSDTTTSVQVNWSDELGNINAATYPVAPSLNRISFTAWQDRVYFVQDGLGTMRRFNPTVPSFQDVPGSPTNGKFVFILDNNLVIIRKNGTIYEVVWSVDSLPEDFAGAGSGSNILSNIGEVRGVGVLDDRAVIIGSAGAIVMVPTGSVPAFAFRDIAAIEGTPFDYAVAASENSVYFYGYDRQLYVYNDGGVRQLGDGEGQIVNNPYIYFLKRLGLLAVCVPDESLVLFLDTQTGKWVSTLPMAMDFFSDYPTNHDAGLIHAYRNLGLNRHDEMVLDLDPAEFTLPSFELGEVELDNEWIMDYIDVHRTSHDSPKPLAMEVERTTRYDITETDIFDASNLTTIQEIGHKLRYYLTRVAMAFRIRLSVAGLPTTIGDGPFLVDQLNSGGNVPVDSDNDVNGQRAELNAADNAEITAVANLLYGDGVNASGNLILSVTPQLEWVRNTGIESIQVRLKKQTLEEVQTA